MKFSGWDHIVQLYNMFLVLNNGAADYFYQLVRWNGPQDLITKESVDLHAGCWGTEQRWGSIGVFLLGHDHRKRSHSVVFAWS
jgi:hypothetical protein